MVTMNVFYVLVVLHHAPVTGGTGTNILAQLFYYKLIDGSMIVEMEIKKKDLRKLQMN